MTSCWGDLSDHFFDQHFGHQLFGRGMRFDANCSDVKCLHAQVGDELSRGGNAIGRQVGQDLWLALIPSSFPRVALASCASCVSCASCTSCASGCSSCFCRCCHRLTWHS